ncbi:MerR family transcriptional regulator [Albibacillus kandeliae]|uniref:MerR family transcriptional regulator n=1 Tax=Albibacillus kandeliae TaxID=2174228 RepID=UPI000D689062|nr:MerR family transcriptional regulator [Albibacillus kandeliae]
MSYSESDVLARITRLDRQELRIWVQQGWIVPAQGETGVVYDEIDVARIRLICDLRQDMTIPDDMVPVVLSLIDQVHGLRREFRTLAEAVEHQPEEIRAAVIAEFRTLTQDAD